MPSISNAVRDDLRFDPSSWVPLVRRMTPKTRFIMLEPHVVTQLTTGPVRIPSSADRAGSSVYDTWSDGTPIAAATEEEEDTIDKLSPELEALRCAIDELIADELNGAVCPKLGSRCPFDATWAMISRNTRCDNASDVLTLISASERATPDITTITTTTSNSIDAEEETNSTISLALRQWANIDTRRELRCFVWHGVLVALCPRRHQEQFTYADGSLNTIKAEITRWLRDTVHPRVTDLLGLSYIVDIYAAVSGNNNNNTNYWVIDFAAWRADTDPLVFTWEELEAAEWMNNNNGSASLMEEPQFRSVEQALRPSDEMYYGLPLELRNADSAQMIAEAARALVQQEKEDEQNSNTKEEEE